MGKPDGEVAVRQVDDEGYAIVLDETPSDIDAARNVGMNCPEGAIQVEGL